MNCTQSSHVRLDDFSSFIDSLGTLEGQAYGLEATAELIGDEYQLAIDCCRVQTMGRAAVTQPLEVL